MVELTPQISSRNSLYYSQTTPHYTPIYKPITMSTENSKINLVLNSPQPNHTGNGDNEVILFTEIPEQVDKAPPHNKEDKYKVKDHSPSKTSEKKPSLFQNLRSKISKRCKVKESNLKVFLGSCSLILMLVSVALIAPFGVYFSHNKDTTLIYANSALSYIAFSLSADPILDIKAKDLQSSCPQEYESLLLGVWPGTKPGCECSTYYHSDYCYRGRGSTEGSCFDISPMNPIDMYDWGGSEWCVLKAKPRSQYKKAAKCPEGFRKCSSGICVLETLDCPVTRVKIEGGAIVTQSVVGEPPVIGFSITPNDVPCFSDDYFARGPIDPYILINENEYGCSKYGPDDKYSFAFGKEKQGNMYGQNDFPKRVYDLPSYSSFYQQTDSVLSYRKRISVAEKDVCLNVNTEILQRPSNVTKDLNRFLYGTLIAAFVIHGLLIFLMVFFVPLRWGEFESWSQVLKGDGESKIWIIVYFIGAFLEYIDLIVMFAATVHFRAKMIGVKDYLRELAEEGCFLDVQAQSATSDYQSIVDVVAGNFFRYSLSIFLVGSLGVFSCGYLCYLLWKSRERRVRISWMRGFPERIR